jgi:putative hemolysin
MLLPGLLLFVLFLALSAFFSASETAFVASNPYTLEYLEKKGSKKARFVRQALSRIDRLLTTILVGNTLVNAAAASLATYIINSLIPDKNQAVLLATLVTTVLILFFGEINPKTYAAHNPVKTAFWLIHPLRFFMALFSPVARFFSFLARILFPSASRTEGFSRKLGEEEVRILMSTGVRGLSTLRRKMIAGVLDIGSRSVREIMVPRPQVRTIDADSTFEQVRDAIRTAGFSRYPVFSGRRDNIEGILHAKDVIPLVGCDPGFSIRSIVRKPFFVPESASMEKVMVQMQENAVHMAIVVDEFGSIEGIVTLEDIIEEIVGEIRDEHDDAGEEWLTRLEEGAYRIKGSAPIKEINETLLLNIPEKNDYTTLAGFLLYEFGRIPQEKEALEYGGHRFLVEKMNKRHISLIQVRLSPNAEGSAS